MDEEAASLALLVRQAPAWQALCAALDIPHDVTIDGMARHVSGTCAAVASLKAAWATCPLLAVYTVRVTVKASDVVAAVSDISGQVLIATFPRPVLQAWPQLAHAGCALVLRRVSVHALDAPSPRYLIIDEASIMAVFGANADPVPASVLALAPGAHE